MPGLLFFIPQKRQCAIEPWTFHPFQKFPSNLSIAFFPLTTFLPSANPTFFLKSNFPITTYRFRFCFVSSSGASFFGFFPKLRRFGCSAFFASFSRFFR